MTEQVFQYNFITLTWEAKFPHSKAEQSASQPDSRQDRPDPRTFYEFDLFEYAALVAGQAG